MSAITLEGKSVNVERILKRKRMKMKTVETHAVKRKYVEAFLPITLIYCF